MLWFTLAGCVQITCVRNFIWKLDSANPVSKQNRDKRYTFPKRDLIHSGLNISIISEGVQLILFWNIVYLFLLETPMFFIEDWAQYLSKYYKTITFYTYMSKRQEISICHKYFPYFIISLTSGLKCLSLSVLLTIILQLFCYKSKLVVSHRQSLETIR